jgi:ATP-dependent protease ClpP protease subunit
MGNWAEILLEHHALQTAGEKAPQDVVRRKYLKKLHDKTERNVIAYYSGWLQRGNTSLDVIINDKDKNAFMSTIHKLDRTKGLDLILHTPGGDLAATESIVDYLYQMFGNDIRAIIPQISMSAGTMIALSSKEIMMGKQSNLGPIDPQMGGVACQAILDEFEKAVTDVRSRPHAAPLWQVIIAKYNPTLLGECKGSIDWSEKLVKGWLLRNMCEGNEKAADKILREFGDHNAHKSHSRHISKETCKEIGLKIVDLEIDNELQDLVLSVHHAFMITMQQTPTTKLVENHLGAAYVESMPIQVMLGQQQLQPHKGIALPIGDGPILPQ